MRILKFLLAQVLQFFNLIFGIVMALVSAVGLFFSLGFVVLVVVMCRDGSISFFPEGLFVLFLAFLFSPFGIPAFGIFLVNLLDVLCEKLRNNEPILPHSDKVKTKKMKLEIKSDSDKHFVKMDDFDDSDILPPWSKP